MFTGLKQWALVGVVCLVLGSLLVSTGYLAGFRSASQEATEREMEAARGVAEREKLLLQAVNTESLRVRELEKKHEQIVADLRADFARTEAEAQAADAVVVADLLAGARRLRLEASACYTARLSEAGTSAQGVHAAQTAELTGPTSAALWGIAADGDAAIRELTGLQAWAASAWKLCGGKQP